MAAPVFGAADNLSLGADWEPQGSDGGVSQDRATASGNDGDIVAEEDYHAVNSGSTRYIYIGEETAFVAAIEAASAWPGMVLNSLMITGIGIDYAPCAQGKRPVVAFQHRDGPSASTRSYKSATVLPTYVTGAVSVPTILTATAGDAECTNAQWGIAAQFGEDLDKDGAFLAGDCYGGEESLALTWVGIPTSVTSTGWTKTADISTTCPIRSNTGYNEGGTMNFVKKITNTPAA